MSIGPILAQLREKEVTIWAEGDRLRCEAPPGILTPELRALLAQHKAELLESLSSAQQRSREPTSVVPLQRHRGGTPIFAVPGHNGDVFCYHALSRNLGVQQPFFGLQPPAFPTVKARFERLRKSQPTSHARSVRQRSSLLLSPGSVQVVPSRSNSPGSSKESTCPFSYWHCLAALIPHTSGRITALRSVL